MGRKRNLNFRNHTTKTQERHPSFPHEDHLILCILLDKEWEVPDCCHENVSCLLCGEERENAGNHSLPFSDTHDLYKVVITWPVGKKNVNLGQQEQYKNPFPSYTYKMNILHSFSLYNYLYYKIVRITSPTLNQIIKSNFSSFPNVEHYFKNVC